MTRTKNGADLARRGPGAFLDDAVRVTGHERALSVALRPAGYPLTPRAGSRFAEVTLLQMGCREELQVGMSTDAIHEVVRGELATASALRQKIQERIHLAAAETRSDWRQLEANVIEVERAARLNIDDESRGLLARAIARLRSLHASLER